MIGVFGGTFDPPHIGHLILADEACGRLQLERVLWVVTGQPPHKPDQPIAPIERRLDMVKLAIAGDPRFEISMVEVDRPGPHFAADTLEILSAESPGERWAYVMGKDSLRDLPRWHEPQQLIRMSSALVVLNRPDVEVDLDQLEGQLPGLGGKLHYLPVPLIDISSREIRQRIAGGAPFRYLVPQSIVETIDSSGLYR